METLLSLYRELIKLDKAYMESGSPKIKAKIMRKIAEINAIERPA